MVWRKPVKSYSSVLNNEKRQLARTSHLGIVRHGQNAKVNGHKTKEV